MKFLLAFIISAASLSNAHIEDKKLILREIMALPPHCCHEESRESFQKRLVQGKFWVDPEDKISYLFINGDGVFGKRLFILHQNSDLYILSVVPDDRGEYDQDNPDYALERYDRLKKELFFIGAFKRGLFER